MYSFRSQASYDQTAVININKGNEHHAASNAQKVNSWYGEPLCRGRAGATRRKGASMYAEKKGLARMTVTESSDKFASLGDGGRGLFVNSRARTTGCPVLGPYGAFPQGQALGKPADDEPGQGVPDHGVLL